MCLVHPGWPEAGTYGGGVSRPDTSALAIVARSGLLAGAAAAVFAVLAGLTVTGAAAAGLLSDPGAVVRWGLPVLSAVQNVSWAATAGALILAALAVPPLDPAARRGRAARMSQARGHHYPRPIAGSSGTNPAWNRLWALGSWAGIVWALSSGLVTVFSYADVFGRPLTGAGFSAELGVFVSQVELGRAWLVVTVAAALIATLAFGWRTVNGAATLACLTLAALVPRALIGHAAGTANHDLAVGAIGLHLLGAVVWIGGLIALAAVADLLGPDTAAVARRYSAVALVAFAVVAYSGVVSAWLRLGSWAGLATGYGALVAGKTACLAALGVVGWAHRRRLLPRLGTGRPDGSQASGAAARPFWRLVAAEFVLMGVASGLAAALAQSAPPVPQAPPAVLTPALRITGQPLPPEPGWSDWVTRWSIDPLWLVIAVVLATFYLAGAVRLARRGDRWPVGRTVCWLAGCLALVWVTGGGVAVWGEFLFSAHMVQHMTVTMVVPLLFVLGAPVTLLMRADEPRTDSSRGWREWALALVHSRWFGFFAHPVVAAVNFAGSLIVFYYTPLFGLALRAHVGHELMFVHFLLAGYLFASAIVGVDPGPRQLRFPMRLMLLLGTMAFHAFFGVTLMTGTALLQAGWFGSLGRPWGPDAITDQQTGGGIAWSIGEIPTLILAVVVAVQWARSDERESARRDRKVDRAGEDAELDEYNAMLARLAERDESGEESRRG